MKAAAPQALVSSLVKTGDSAKTAASGTARSGQSAGGAFFRILAERLGLKDARAGRPQAGRSAQGQIAAGTSPADGEMPGEGASDGQPVGTKGAAETRGAVASAKRRASRGLLADAALDLAAGGATSGIEAAENLPSRKADPRRNAAESVVPVGRRPAEPRLFVLDLRRNAQEVSAEAKVGAGGVQAQASGREGDGTINGLAAGARTAALRDAASGPRGAKPPAGPARPFETALERLRGMAGSEMVKASGIILRDGGGEIRLVLKPESLGSVRIRMNLVDNGIEGRIIVDNAAVKQVLDGSLDTLEKALTAQGFQTASLEVSVGGQNTEGGRTAQEPHPALRRESAEGFERNVPGVESVSLGDLLVNLFV